MSVSNGPNLHKMINALTGDSFDIDFRAFLRMIDSLVQAAVLSKTLTAPPGSPANGARYIVGVGATGAWAGSDNNIATWTTDNPSAPSGQWNFYAPNAGFDVFNVADSKFYFWTGSAWATYALSSVQQAGTGRPSEPALNFLAPITATDNSGAGSTDVAVPVVVGDSGSGGVKGLVPAPGAGDAAAGKFLKADGTYQIPPGTGGATFYQTVEQATTSRTQRGALNFVAPITATDNVGNTSTDIAVPNMVGDSGSGGTAGLVPAAPSGSAAAGKFLKADGTFAVPPGGSTGPACQTRKKQGSIIVADTGTGVSWDLFGERLTKFNSTQINGYQLPDANGGTRTEDKSTSATVDAAWGLFGTDPQYRTGKHIELWAAVRFTDTADCAHWIAMNTSTSAAFGNSDTNSALKFAGFRYSTIAGDSHWQCVTGDGSAITVTDSGITPDGKEHRFGIFFDDDNSQILFYIDGVLVGTNTTHLPGSGTNMNFYISSRKHSGAPGSGNLVGWGQIVVSGDF